MSNYPCIYYGNSAFFPDNAFAKIVQTSADIALGRQRWTVVDTHYSQVYTRGTVYHIWPKTGGFGLNRIFIIPPSPPNSFFESTASSIRGPWTPAYLPAMTMVLQIKAQVLKDPSFAYDEQVMYVDPLFLGSTNSAGYVGGLTSNLYMLQYSGGYYIYQGNHTTGTPTGVYYRKTSGTDFTGTYSRTVAGTPSITYTITVEATTDFVHPFPYVRCRVPLIGNRTTSVNFFHPQSKTVPPTPLRLTYAGVTGAGAPGATIGVQSLLNMAIGSDVALTEDAVSTIVQNTVPESTITEFEKDYLNQCKSWIANSLNKYFIQPCDANSNAVIPANLNGAGEWKYLLGSGGSDGRVYRIPANPYMYSPSDTTLVMYNGGYTYVGGLLATRKTITALAKRERLPNGTITNGIYSIPTAVYTPSQQGIGGLYTDSSPAYDHCGCWCNGGWVALICSGVYTYHMLMYSLASLRVNAGIVRTGTTWDCGKKVWSETWSLYMAFVGSSSGGYSDTLIWTSTPSGDPTIPVECYRLGTYTLTTPLVYKSPYAVAGVRPAPPTLPVIPSSVALCDKSTFGDTFNNERQVYNDALDLYVADQALEQAFNALYAVINGNMLWEAAETGITYAGSTGPYLLPIPGSGFTGATGAECNFSLFNRGMPYVLPGPRSFTGASITGSQFGSYLTGPVQADAVGGDTWFTPIRPLGVMDYPWYSFVAEQLTGPVMTFPKLLPSITYTNQYTRETGPCAGTGAGQLGLATYNGCCTRESQPADKPPFYGYGVIKDKETPVRYWKSGGTDDHYAPVPGSIYQTFPLRFQGPLAWNGFSHYEAYPFQSTALHPIATSTINISTDDAYSFVQQAQKLFQTGILNRRYGSFIRTINESTLARFYVESAEYTIPDDTDQYDYRRVNIPGVYNSYNNEMKDEIIGASLSILNKTWTGSGSMGTGCYSPLETGTWTFKYYSAVDILSTYYNGVTTQALVKFTKTQATYTGYQSEPDTMLMLLPTVCRNEMANVLALTYNTTYSRVKRYVNGWKGATRILTCTSTQGAAPCTQSLVGVQEPCVLEDVYETALCLFRQRHVTNEDYATASPSGGHYIVTTDTNCQTVIVGAVNNQGQVDPLLATSTCGGTSVRTTQTKMKWYDSTTVLPCMPLPSTAVSTLQYDEYAQWSVPNKIIRSIIISASGNYSCSSKANAGKGSIGNWWDCYPPGHPEYDSRWNSTHCTCVDTAYCSDGSPVNDSSCWDRFDVRSLGHNSGSSILWSVTPCSVGVLGSALACYYNWIQGQDPAHATPTPLDITLTHACDYHNGYNYINQPIMYPLYYRTPGTPLSGNIVLDYYP